MTQEVHPLAAPGSSTQSVEVWPVPAEPGTAAPVAGGPPDPPELVQRRSARWNSIRLIPRTLTARLVAGVGALVIIIVTATGAVTYYKLHSFLYSRLDQQVNSQADQTLAAVMTSTRFGCDPATTMCEITDRRNFGGPPAAQTPWLVLLAPNGQVRSSIASGTDIEALNLSSGTRESLMSAGRATVTVTTTDGHSVRVVVRAADGFVLVSGLATNEVDETLHRLFLLELAIGGTGILLALLLTAVGMSLGLRPLKRVTRTAQEVTAELSPDGAGLDRRVSDIESTTEVGQLATSFNTMLDTVEAEFRARRESEERMRQFLADASHELRTPLTSIRGYAELARMQKAREGTAADDDTLGRIETEGTRMSRLVDDLLILARGDEADNSESIDRSSIDIGEVVNEVVAGVRAAHPDRTIVTQLDPGLTFFGDHDQILRALRNLATNAAIHTDPAGPIRVGGHREGASIVLQVVDQGPGLAPAEAQHVFERFWRADKARTRVRGGSGLGMAIVSQIVEAHGGRVCFDSTVEHGSTVTVVLPGGVA